VRVQINTGTDGMDRNDGQTERRTEGHTGSSKHQAAWSMIMVTRASESVIYQPVCCPTFNGVSPNYLPRGLLYVTSHSNGKKLVVRNIKINLAFNR